MALLSENNFARWKNWLALGMIAAAVLVAFAAATQLSFFGDDWIFLDIVGRLNLHDYLVRYFDPNAQTAWYRPVQGIQYLIGYRLFGSDPFGYHLENVLLHLVNCWLLFGLVARVTKQWRIGVIAALMYATFPLAVEALFRAGVIDPLLTVFSLLSIWFWLRYLEGSARRDYWLTFANFILALYCKEISIMLPIILFLIDRWYIAKPTTRRELVRRYFWFAVAFIPYVPIEYIVTRRSVFVSFEGYSPSARILPNLIGYLSGLSFPWVFAPPFSYLCLIVALALLAYFIFWKKQFALVAIVAVAVLPVLPIAPFPQVSPRFLYFPLTAVAMLFALLLDWIWRRLPHTLPTRALAFGIVALAVLIGSASIAQATAAFADLSRVSRVSFRNVWQVHPTLPAGTLLYFFYPPVPGTNLSGMFFSRYGSSVESSSTDSDVPANLRAHPLAYVYYFDDHGDQFEQRVDPQAVARANPAPPVDFAAPIRLEGLELVNAQVKQGQPILLLLYWQALKPIAKDYTVFVHLIDQRGVEVAGYEKEPRRSTAPTSTWVPGARIVDAIVLPLPNDLPAADSYRLEVGMFDAATQQRVPILGADGKAPEDRIVIAPVSIVK